NHPDRLPRYAACSQTEHAKNRGCLRIQTEFFDPLPSNSGQAPSSFLAITAILAFLLRTVLHARSHPKPQVCSRNSPRAHLNTTTGARAVPARSTSLCRNGLEHS